MTTSPVEGKIYIDGKYVEDGFYSGEYVVGTHTVSFGDVVEYVTPDSQTVVVKAGEAIEIKGDYTKRFKGKIRVTTEPVKGAIYVNGKRVGIGEFEGEYYEGTKLSVSFGNVEGYDTPENPPEITIEANKTKSIVGGYKPKPKGEIYIKTTSDRGDVEGDIYVDGSYVGVGSCTVERTIGTYTISYGDVKGYKKPPSRSIEVEAGRTKKVVDKYEYISVPPEVKILSPGEGASILADTPVNLNSLGNDPDGRIDEYMWSVDGLAIGHGKELQGYKFRKAGEHTITVVAIDNDGLYAEANVKVHVIVEPVINLNINPAELKNTSDNAMLSIEIKSLLTSPSAIVEIQKIDCTEGTFMEEHDKRDILTSFEVMSGKPEIKIIEVRGTESGKSYSIKLKGYYWFENDPINKNPIESNTVKFKVRPTLKEKGPGESPGFEAVFALIGLLAVAYLIIRRKKE